MLEGDSGMSYVNKDLLCKQQTFILISYVNNVMTSRSYQFVGRAEGRRARSWWGDTYYVERGGGF